MRRLRRAVIQCSRVAGLVLGAAIFFCVGGLGLHAARDWHRHGEFGAGFFHLHFHVGEHDHEHPAHDDHDHDTAPDGQRKRTAVLTIAHAIHDAVSAAPAVASPESTLDRTPIECVILPRITELSSFANPRAPPV